MRHLFTIICIKKIYCTPHWYLCMSDVFSDILITFHSKTVTFASCSFLVKQTDCNTSEHHWLQHILCKKYCLENLGRLCIPTNNTATINTSDCWKWINNLFLFASKVEQLNFNYIRHTYIQDLKRKCDQCSFNRNLSNCKFKGFNHYLWQKWDVKWAFPFHLYSRISNQLHFTSNSCHR